MSSKADFVTAIGATTLIGDGVAFTRDAGNVLEAAAAHGKQTGYGPVRLTTTTTLPAGLSTGTDYFIVDVDGTKFSLATSLANAMAGTVVEVTDAGTGTHTMRATGAGLANELERVLDFPLTAAGGRVNPKAVNDIKFWEGAIGGAGF